jgi:hypothetical protein
VIIQDTSQLKLDTAQILDEIARLRAQLPPEAQETSNLMLERYLENLTSYAETVIEDIPSTPTERPRSPVAPTEDSQSEDQSDQATPISKDVDPRPPTDIMGGSLIEQTSQKRSEQLEIDPFTTIPLTNGKLVINYPSMVVFRPSPYVTPQNEYEFVKQRFSVITGKLHRLPEQYTLRPKKFHPPRLIKTLFTIDGIHRLRGGIDLSLRLATTLNSIISGISHITCSRRPGTWKKFVVCLLLRQISSEELISLLWQMGFRSLRGRKLEYCSERAIFGREFVVESDPRGYVNDEPIDGYLYEVSNSR